MPALFRVNGAAPRSVAIDDWLASLSAERGDLARRWFERMRACGAGVREVMHDGQATACVEDVPFAYVGVFRDHVNVGFFHGASLADPAGLLEGSGKSMRHVKLRPGVPVDDTSLDALIAAAHRDVVARLA
jgi:hypothetical protein